MAKQTHTITWETKYFEWTGYGEGVDMLKHVDSDCFNIVVKEMKKSGKELFTGTFEEYKKFIIENR